MARIQILSTLLLLNPLYFSVACSTESADQDGGGGVLGVGVGGSTNESSTGGSDSSAGGSESAVGGSSGGTSSGSAESAGGSENATGGTAGDSGGSESGGAASGGEDPGGGSGGEITLGQYPTPDCSAPIDLGVRIVGRHDGCDSAGVTMAWSGAGFVARFEGTGLSFTQKGSAVQYTAIIDNQLMTTLSTTSGEQTYEVVSGLPAGEHTVEVYRRGEANFGATTLLSVDPLNGSLLPPPSAPNRRIEVFGDSISCGYGNEGDSATCGFSADTENHYLTYGGLLARYFEAVLSTVAWSGKGVVINYGGDTSTTLPEMLDRANPNSDASVWDYTLATPPQAVIINLGTNDYSTDSDPSDNEFVTEYTQMLEKLRIRYPDAFILCVLAPLLSGSDLDIAMNNIKAAVAARNAAGDGNVASFDMAANNPNPGCDYHPSLSTHEAMADELKAPLSAALGW
jgi:lysophospholipase L1-like esterase